MSASVTKFIRTVNPRVSNTDEVKQTDRTAGGPQPDNTPVGGGTQTGGPLPPGTSVTMVGDVIGPSDANTVHDISDLHQFVQAPIGYATGGTVQIRFDLGSFDDIGLTTNVSFSPAGSSGMTIGKQQRLVIRNTTGGALTAAYNSSWQGASVLPTSLPVGYVGSLVLSCTGTTEASISAVMIPGIIGAAIGPIGDATHVAQVTRDAFGRVTALSSVAITFPPSTGDYTWNIFKLGAVPNSTGAAGANVTVINAAIAAIVAAGGGTLFVPEGIFYINALLTVSGAINFTAMGEGAGVSQLVQVTANTGVFDINLTTPGTYLQHKATIKDLLLGNNVTSSIAAASCVQFNANATGGGDRTTNLDVINCTFICNAAAASYREYVKIIDADYCTFINCSFFGGSGNNTGSHGIILAGVSNQNVGLICDVCLFRSLDRGTHLTNAGGGDMQGCYFQACDWLVCVVCVEIDNNVDEVAFNDCQLDFLQNGILQTGVNGADSCSVQGSLFFTNRNPNLTAIVGQFTRGTFTANTFIGVNQTGNRAFDLTGDANTIFGNVFMDMDGWSVKQAGTGSRIYGNVDQYTGAPTVPPALPYVEAGANIFGQAIGGSVVLAIGTATFFIFSVDISAAQASGIPSSGFCNIIDPLPNQIRGSFNWGNGGNTARLGFFVLWMEGGAALPGGSYRIGWGVTP